MKYWTFRSPAFSLVKRIFNNKTKLIVIGMVIGMASQLSQYRVFKIALKRGGSPPLGGWEILPGGFFYRVVGI